MDNHNLPSQRSFPISQSHWHILCRRLIMEHVPGWAMTRNSRGQLLISSIFTASCSGSREIVYNADSKKSLDRWNKSRSGNYHVDTHQNTEWEISHTSLSVACSTTCTRSPGGWTYASDLLVLLSAIVGAGEVLSEWILGVSMSFRPWCCWCWWDNNGKLFVFTESTHDIRISASDSDDDGHSLRRCSNQ